MAKLLFMLLGTNVFLCDFHREQAWVRWVNTSRNNISAADKDGVLAMLRNIAHAMTPDQYSESLQSLQQSPQWKLNILLQQWFNKKWIPHYKASISHSV